MIRAVKFRKGPNGQTHEGRYLDYYGRYVDVIRKIPEDLLPPAKIHARIIREAVEPGFLRAKVKKCTSFWISPVDNKRWDFMSRAYESVEATLDTISHLAEWLDGQIETGVVPKDYRAWDAATAGEASDVCRHWKNGTCTKGDKCKWRHEGPSGGGTAPSKPPGGGGDKLSGLTEQEKKQRCDYDRKGQKCPRGNACYFGHYDTSVNAFKKPKSKANRDHSGKTCNACGEKGHIVWNCKKLKAHAADLKKLIGYTGQHNWFNNTANAKKSQDLFRAKQWFAKTDSGRAAQKGQLEEILPFKLEADWLDGGWCTVGAGDNAVKLRLFVDLGATCNIGSTGLYGKLVKMAKEGKLGAAKRVTNMARMDADMADGAKTKMKNWLQLVIQAPNIRGNKTIVWGQYVAFVRQGDEPILIAGKDLANELGYLGVKQQQAAALATGGVDPDKLLGKRTLGEGAPPRKYALSNETTRRMAEQREIARRYSAVLADGRVFLGDDAFRRVRSCMYVSEPRLKHSYLTTAALAMAGTKFATPKGERPGCEFALGHLASIADWLGYEEAVDKLPRSTPRWVQVPIIRILRDTERLARLPPVRFLVLEGDEPRCVIGRDISRELDRQEDDRPDPLQTDLEFDERAEIINFLEAAFDWAKMAGLPEEHVPRYRKLIFETYFHAFRLRLCEKDPAAFAPMRVHVKPGSKLRKPRVIPLRLPRPAMQALREELENYQKMGVIGDADPHEVLSSLLTVKKPGGGLRWVIPCLEANEISVAAYWMAPDNADEQQSRMLGAVYFFVADMLKGFWQLELDKASQWLFCFATPWGPKKWLRAPMGSKVTAPYFDRCVAGALENAGLLRNGIEMIHDDHGGYAPVIYEKDPSSNSHYHILRRSSYGTGRLDGRWADDMIYIMFAWSPAIM